MYEWRHLMRKCAPLRGSSTSKYLKSSFSISTSNPKEGQDAGTTEVDVLAQDEATGDVSDEIHNSADHGNQASKHSRPILPLSPLMDPAYQAAKQKYRSAKPPPSKERTPFQQQLAKNPYAQALASPVRICALTRTCLPAFFLLDFELIAHPTTSEPWYLPRSLSSPCPSAASNSPASPDSIRTSTESSSPSSIEGIQPSSPPPTVPEYSTNLPAKGTRQGPRAYVLSRACLLRGTLTPKTGYTRGWERFPLNRSTHWKAFPTRKIRWRSDIDTFVLELMRRRVVDDLKYLLNREKGYVFACGPGRFPFEIAGKKQVGTFLWFGEDKAIPDTTEEEVKSSEPERRGSEEQKAKEELERWLGVEKPGEFATWDKEGGLRSKIPVHNLQILLGEKYVKELRHFSLGIFGTDLAAVRHKRATVGIQLRLWKLQGYLARHGADV